MNRFTVVPPLLDTSAHRSVANIQEADIVAVVHELKNQACTLGLGIAALKYPDENDDERQRHLAALEAVIGAMSRQFHRLDEWLVETGYKRNPGEPESEASRRRAKKPRNRDHQISTV